MTSLTESKKFIINKLESLNKIYSNINIRYYFDKFDNDHYLAILPNHILRDVIENHALALDLDFIKNFPNESLTFLAPDEFEEEFEELVYTYIPSFQITKASAVKINSIKDSSFYSIIIDSYLDLHKNNVEKREEIINKFVMNAGNEEFALAA